MMPDVRDVARRNVGSLPTAADRRTFLKLAAAGGLVVAVPLALRGRRGSGEADDQPRATVLNAFIRVTEANEVHVISPSIEMGQGAHTTIAMLVAEELGADWAKMRVLNAPLAEAYFVPKQGLQATDGSQTVRTFYLPVRIAAATARHLLFAAAARRWGVPAADCHAERSEVRHLSGRSYAFGELAADAATLPRPAKVALKQHADRTVLGKRLPRVDIASKVNGSAEYGCDVRVPEMVYAAIRQVPNYGTPLDDIDTGDVLARRGVIKVVKLPTAAAVVADTFWGAKSAAADLKLRHSSSPVPSRSTADIMAEQRRLLEAPKVPIGIQAKAPSDGKVTEPAIDSIYDVQFVYGPDRDAGTKTAGAARQTQIKGAAPESRPVASRVDGLSEPVTPSPGRGRAYERFYSVPFLHHASMEPPNCTVHLHSGQCDIWASHQSMSMLVEAAKKITGLAAEDIHVTITNLGGAFGRKFETDYIEQAVRIAQQVDGPVQLLWTREEDVQHGFYRPGITARMRAILTEDGDVPHFVLRSAGPSILEHTTGSPLVNGVDPIAMMGISTETESAPGLLQQYTVPSFRAEYAYQKTPIPVGYHRSVGAGPNAFFIESFIDELAAEAEIDPYQFRRRLLRDSPRALTVLDRCAKQAGWTNPPARGRARGMAFTDIVGSLVCQIAEVSVDGGTFKVERIVCVIDCGVVVNPDIVEAQIEGGIAFGLSAVLGEAAIFAGSASAQSNFNDYAVLTMAQMPQVQVHIIESGYGVGGVGEAGVAGVAPAVCNALYAAAGRRIRSLPIGEQWRS